MSSKHGDKEDFHVVFKTEFLLLSPKWPTKQQTGGANGEHMDDTH